MGLIRVVQKKHKSDLSNAETMTTSRNYSTYYDKPDGEDVKTKMIVASRYGIVTGLIFSTYDVMMYSHATGFGNIIMRYMYHTVPLGLMGATFAFVAYNVQHLRKKDDELNYAIGGFSCGPILGYYLKSRHAVFIGGLFLAACAVIKKTGVDEGWTFFPDVQGHMGYVNSWRNDWTFSKDPKDEMVNSYE